MPDYAKTPIAPGQTISSTWGNDVQTQHEKVVGTNSDEITPFQAAIMPVDSRSLHIFRTGGVITDIAERGTLGQDMITYQVIRTNGVITSLKQSGYGKVVTHTINRTAGQITSITKGVV
jgi:hypothetical protein